MAKKAKKAKKKGKGKSPQGDLFDGDAAKAARDEGMERVLREEDEFKDAAGKFIISLPGGWEGIFEDIRRVYKGVKPHHPNAWGAVCNAAIKRGVLVKVGMIMRRTTAVKSHSRPTHLLRRT